ncbi:SHOCT domain-containing protein [Brachyspira sp.]|uniref:SHOCT domain-containing protein n=1 Tax=Brachyspira sp. TaxID=1977261 RepID=UPI003D7D31C7
MSKEKVNKLFEIAKTKLNENETVEDYINVFLESSIDKINMPLPAVLIATNKRLFFYLRMTLGLKEQIESFDYNIINSISLTKDATKIFNPFPHLLEINTINKNFVLKISANELKSNKVQNFTQAINNKIASVKSSNENQNIDIASQIEKLAELKNKGILNEEEFNKKKNELLARL